MRHARIALAAALATGLLGCAGFAQMIGAPLDRPRLVFAGMEARDLDLEGVTLGLKWRVENPNGVALKLASLDYRLEVERRQALSGAAGGGLSIPSRGSAVVDLPVRLRFADVPGLLASLASKDQLRWRIDGTAGVDTGLGVVELPFSEEGVIPLREKP